MTPELWAMVAMAIASVLVSFLTKASMKDWIKVLIVAVTAIVIGVVTQLVKTKGEMGWDWDSILIILGFGWAWFWGIMKTTGLDKWLQEHGVHD